jgi:hypothetical protein
LIEEDLMADTHQVGRVAMRVEGTLWVAYFARMGTMDDALFLGSIQMAFVQDPDRRHAFMGLIQQAVGEILATAAGQVPHWPDPVAAPEHERSGRA